MGIKGRQALFKVVDDEFSYGKHGHQRLRMEVWQDARGRVVKYNLAYIDIAYSSIDNGRVLGYDNNHGRHHRHFLGVEEPWDFKSYELLVERFQSEVEEFRRRK